MLNLRTLHDSHELFDDRYELKSRLGGGGFSEVWLALDTKSRTEVALKVYVQTNDLDDDGLEMFRKEFSLVCNFNHSNILRPFSYEITEDHPYLVLPYCPRGSSRQFVGRMPEHEMWHFIENVAAGLEYLHSYPEKPVIHQDIKPANILIDATGQYLITDFGISIHLRNTFSRNSAKENNSSGTLAYMAPERFDEVVSMPVMANDIWSLGATLYELATGNVPFGEFGGMTQCHVHKPTKFNIGYSDQLTALIYSCLSENPWDRPTARDLRIAAEGKEFKIKRRSRTKKGIYKKSIIALAICGAVFFGLMTFNNMRTSAPEPHISEPNFHENNQIALNILDSADRVVEQHKSRLKNHRALESIHVDTLKSALKIYDDALKVSGCSDTIYTTIQLHKTQAINQLITPAYTYFKQRENEYKSVGAYNAAEKFHDRCLKIEDLIQNIDNQ